MTTQSPAELAKAILARREVGSPIFTCGEAWELAQAVLDLTARVGELEESNGQLQVEWNSLLEKAVTQRERAEAAERQRDLALADLKQALASRDEAMKNQTPEGCDARCKLCSARFAGKPGVIGSIEHCSDDLCPLRSSTGGVGT